MRWQPCGLTGGSPPFTVRVPRVAWTARCWRCLRISVRPKLRTFSRWDPTLPWLIIFRACFGTSTNPFSVCWLLPPWFWPYSLGCFWTLSRTWLTLVLRYAWLSSPFPSRICPSRSCTSPPSSPISWFTVGCTLPLTLMFSSSPAIHGADFSISCIELIVARLLLLLSIIASLGRHTYHYCIFSIDSDQPSWSRSFSSAVSGKALKIPWRS